MPKDPGAITVASFRTRSTIATLSNGIKLPHSEDLFTQQTACLEISDSYCSCTRLGLPFSVVVLIVRATSKPLARLSNLVMENEFDVAYKVEEETGGASKMEEELHEAYKIQEKFDVAYKILMLGDTSAGKSWILNSYCRKPKPWEMTPTIGVSTCWKVVTLSSGKKAKLQFWDTTGNERFAALTETAVKETHGALIVLDVTKETALDNLEHWIKFAESYGKQTVPKIVVGNKIDLTKIRAVSREHCQQAVQKYNLAYVEVSATTGQNLEELFHTLVEEVDRVWSSRKQH